MAVFNFSHAFQSYIICASFVIQIIFLKPTRISNYLVSCLIRRHIIAVNVPYILSTDNDESLTYDLLPVLYYTIIPTSRVLLLISLFAFAQEMEIAIHKIEILKNIMGLTKIFSKRSKNP